GVTGGGSGLPCDVGQLLANNCQVCHSAAHPTAPMSLMTYADLHAPAPSDPSKKVYEVALTRVSKKQMPPTAPLDDDAIAIFAAWANAGAPEGECSTDTSDGGTPPPECMIASDCPGTLICRSGHCDVECVSDKDCTPTWTCDETRCTPPSLTP